MRSNNEREVKREWCGCGTHVVAVAVKMRSDVGATIRFRGRKVKERLKENETTMEESSNL